MRCSRLLRGRKYSQRTIAPAGIHARSVRRCRRPAEFEGVRPRCFGCSRSLSCGFGWLGWGSLHGFCARGAFGGLAAAVRWEVACAGWPAGSPPFMVGSPVRPGPGSGRGGPRRRRRRWPRVRSARSSTRADEHGWSAGRRCAGSSRAGPRARPWRARAPGRGREAGGRRAGRRRCSRPAARRCCARIRGR